MAQVKIGTISDVKSGESKLISIKEKALALFNIDGKFFVIDNTCLHKAGSLAQGKVDGCFVTCPLHGWRYDITDGKCVLPGANLRLNSYKVSIKEKDIFIEL